MDKKLEPFQVNEDVWMIPCYSNRESNIYQPMTTPLKISEDMQNINFRQAWSKEEDKALENFINLRGTKAWALIAKEINNLFHDGKNFRKGKQCRERYFNHINPNLKKGNWTEQEDLYIIEMQSANGNKWSDIAKNLSGRNENQVKNRWKSLMNIKMKEKNYVKALFSLYQFRYLQLHHLFIIKLTLGFQLLQKSFRPSIFHRLMMLPPHFIYTFHSDN